jgi:hypothetical protein
MDIQIRFEIMGKHFNRRVNTKLKEGIFIINYEHWYHLLVEKLKKTLNVYIFGK